MLATLERAAKWCGTEVYVVGAELHERPAQGAVSLADAARLRSLATILESAQWGPDGSLDPISCGRIRDLLEEEAHE